MKKIYFLFFLLLTGFVYLKVDSQTPFNKGVNLTGWFQVDEPRQIQFTRFTKQDFINIQRLGCDVIRLPINLHYMTSGEPDYVPDPLFLTFLDSAVRWAEDLNIHLILDNHTFDPAENTDPAIESVLISVWSQMAEHYKNSYNHIYYEVLNEPHGIADATWNSIQQHVIDAIREHDTKHTIIVGPASWNSYNNLENLPQYTDDNLIYTFHFYDPFLFTHQGASWTVPSMEPLHDVPFPYDAAGMPVFPPKLEDTWIEDAFNNYSNDGTTARVRELIDIAIDFRNTRSVPVFCGELGVYIPNSPHQDRVNWYDTVRTYLEENNIAWTIWDYTGGFGIFKEEGNDLFEHDLDTLMLRALGFNVPMQTEFVIVPDSSGFPIYTDYIEHGIIESSYVNSGSLDYYSVNHPNNGNYCTHWIGEEQYSYLGYDFKPDRDFSYLAEQGFAIDFFIRGLSPGTSLDIRFIDTKTDDPDDHPWRMRYTIDETLAPWDGKWHHIFILLNDFTEQGAWDNGWYNPEGLFDWTAVDRFEIVTEYSDLNGSSFWFDNIYGNNQDTASVRDTSMVELPEDIRNIVPENSSLTIFPNPAKDNITIKYTAPDDCDAEICIYDISGWKVATVEHKFQISGGNALIWDLTTDSGRKINPGIYFCRITLSTGISITGRISIQ